MGDDSPSVTAGGFMLRSSDGGEWENVGFISDDGISFSADGDDMDVWQGKLLDLNKTATVALKPEWWSLNRLYKLVYGRYMYTVASLRKEGKGHKRKRTRRAVR